MATKGSKGKARSRRTHARARADAHAVGRSRARVAGAGGFQTHARRASRLWRYGPLVAWAAFVLFASTEGFSANNTSRIIRPLLLWLFPKISEGSIQQVHFYVRKTAHFTEYAILALLAARSAHVGPRGAQALLVARLLRARRRSLAPGRVPPELPALAHGYDLRQPSRHDWRRDRASLPRALARRPAAWTPLVNVSFTRKADELDTPEGGGYIQTHVRTLSVTNARESKTPKRAAGAKYACACMCPWTPEGDGARVT